MKKEIRILSLLLTVVMLLGMLPAAVLATGDCAHTETEQSYRYNGDGTHTVKQICADCGEATSDAEPFTVDFMADAKRMAQHDAWNDLQPSRYYNPQKGAYEPVPDARYVGYGMTSAQQAAAMELQKWIEENCNWHLTNLSSIFSDSKRLTINAGDELSFGLRLWTIYIATGNSGSQTTMEITAPDAGTYDLELSTVLEDGNLNYDGGNAGGVIDIYINGTPVLQGHSFNGNHEIENLLIKDVQLQEGANTVMFYTVKDKNGYTSGYGDAAIPLRYMAFTPASSYDEACTDEDKDLLCDLCGGEMPQQEEDNEIYPDGMVVVDFKAAAEKMSQQDWWQNLRNAKNMATSAMVSQVRGVGRHNSIGDMSAKEKAAYDQLLGWLDENAMWNIDEDKTRLKSTRSTKRVLFNTADADWGLRLSTGNLNTTDHTSRVYLTVNAAKAGTYAMDLSLYRESKALNYDGSNGGGIVSVYVNDELLLENYETLGNNETVILSLGNVQLHEGENSVVFHCIGDMKGKTHLNGADSERAIALRGMIFTLCDGTSGPEVPETAVPAPEAEAVRVNFKETVKEMTAQPWWEALGSVTNMATATYVDGLKGVGRYNAASMSEDNVAAYNAMLAWLGGNANWNIHDAATSFRGDGDSRRLILNGTNTPWGIRMHTALLATDDTASQVQLLVNAPVGGTYELDLSLFKQAQQPNWDGGNGGGYVSIYVGDTLVLENYGFLGSNEVVDLSAGRVQLQSGENVITIHFLADMKGKTHLNGADSERSAALCELTFTPTEPVLQLVKNHGYRYDLRGVYVDIHANITEAVSSDEDVVLTEADADGNVIFRAVGRGEATVTVKDGDGILRTIGVEVKNALPQNVTVTATEGEKVTVQPEGIAATSMTHQVAVSNEQIAKAVIKSGGMVIEALKPGYTTVELRSGGDAAYIVHLLVEKYVEPVPASKKIELSQTVEDTYTHVFTAPADGVYRLYVTAIGDDGEIKVNGDVLYQGALNGRVSVGETELSRRRNTMTVTVQGQAQLQEILMIPVSGNEPVQILQGQRAVVDLHHGYLAAEEAIGQDTFGAVSADETVASAGFNTNGELKIYGHNPGRTEILVMDEELTVCFVQVEVLPREGELPVAETVEMDFMAAVSEMAQQPWWNDLKATDFGAMKVIGNHPEDWLGSMTETEYAAYEQLLAWLEENRSWNFDEDKTRLANLDYTKSVTLNSSGNYGLLFYSGKYLNAGEKSSLYFTMDAAATGVYSMELSAYHSIGTYVNINNACAGGIANIYLNGELIREKYSFASDPSGVITVNLGLVELDEGENSLCVDILSDRFGGTTNSDRAPALRHVRFVPVQVQTVQDYTKKTVDLNKTYLPFDERVSSMTHRAVSSDEQIVKALIDRNGLLELEGTDMGEAQVQIFRGGKLLCTVDVLVTPYIGDIDGLGGNTVKADLDAMTVTIPADGLYAVQVQGSFDGATVSVDGTAVYARLQGSGHYNLGAVTLTAGKHTLAADGADAMVFVPLGTWYAERGRSLYLDLKESYLAFDTDVTGIAARSDAPAVVQAATDEDGDVVLTAKDFGTAHVTVSVAGKTLDLTVQVLKPSDLKELDYTLDGFESATLSVGQTAVGDLRGVTQQGVAVEEKQLRKDGAVYFTSSDTAVATVDQHTGDVTCVGEGSVTITGYGLLEGVTKTVRAALVVTDDTDLAAIRVSAQADYLATGNTLQLHTAGTKSSGAKADMTLYPVTWSVDDETVANVSEDGRLTGLKEGTVTVTATAGVMKQAVMGTITIRVIPDGELPMEDIYLDFAQERVTSLKSATLEQDGMELNREKTYLAGEGFGYHNANGIYVKLPEGESFVLDFAVKRSGWYQLEVVGTSQPTAGRNAYYLDETVYMGLMDFTAGQPGLPWATEVTLNTVWLDAGVHSLEMRAMTEASNELGWYRFHAVEAPGAAQVSLHTRQPLLVGQTVPVTVTACDTHGNAIHLLRQSGSAKYDNFYRLSTSDPKVVSVSGDSLTAVAAGEAEIIMEGSRNGQPIRQTMTVQVVEGVIAEVTLTAEQTTFKPDAEGVQLTATAFGTDGMAVENAEILYTADHDAVASVDESGFVTFTGNTGSVLITATAKDGERQVTASIWLTITEGKTEPTLYTMEKRAIAQENVNLYSWAWSQKEAAVKLADYYVENLDLIYHMWIREGLPRNTQVGFENDPNYRLCRYCGVDLVGLYSHYPWIVDPIENPWKITCPVCKRDFPSNDFESYYKSGLDERGYFHKENADPQFLVNELYPEMGEGWGVDDGWGYKSEGGTHTYINYYIQVVFRSMSSKHGMNDILPALAEAYLFTGDEKYGSAGAILLDRMADIYPEYDFGRYSISNYANADGGNGCGRIVGAIWEADHIGPVLSQAVDAFWPAMDNPDVIEYLRANAAFKGMAAEEITPEYVRENAVNGILLELIQVLYERDCYGNPGMQQEVAATVAVVLDRQPETGELIDWLYQTSVITGELHNYHNSGGDVNRLLVEDVCRDGFGYEVSYLYNSLWPLNLINAAEALADYDKVEGAGLWENQKYVNMFTAMTRLSVCGRLMAQTGEAGAVQSTQFAVVPDDLVTAFARTGNVEIAQCLYFVNGNKVDGLHADIFTKDPESGLRGRIQQIVNTYGEFDVSLSNMMSGFGIAILREGPGKYLPGVNDHQFSDYWMYFGRSGGTGHEKYDALAIDMEGFGIGLSSTMGYPMLVVGGDPEREQWIRNTTSHNTVVVNDRGQSKTYGGFPMHFEDAGAVKVMDAENAAAYPETDIYRRTLVTVAAENGVHYAVDFFRILGGSEHVYSFHAASNTDPVAQGLTLTEQPMGTYAGADVPFGAYYEDGVDGAKESRGGGYSWLGDVWRDDSPDAAFTLDWSVKDFHNRLSTTSGIHLKLHMLSEEPMTEVAIADAVPPQNGTNPDHLEYALVRRSGAEGMDTLFTAVIEPYQHEKLIETAELADVQLTKGSENATDRAAAIKVTLVSGRTDYIVYATNPECTYRVDDLFDFRGFAGMVSYTKGRLIYAWGSEATQVADVIEDAQAAVTGQVLSFTEGIADRYEMTVSMDSSVAAETLTGRYIYVKNDGLRNGAYRIYGARVDGDTAVLDLYSQTLVREYVDNLNLELGYRHNISVGDGYTIPLSATFDSKSILNHTADQIVKAGSKLSLSVGTGKAAYEAEGMPKGMKLDSKTGTLTWTTSKTQTGRYPITVKAIDDQGDVLGTMSFTVYVVSYSGSSYAPDVCAHAKSVTYTITEEDGSVTVETVCPACGMVTKTNGTEEEANKFVITGSNMTLGNELVINFLVKADYVKDGYYAVVTRNGEETVVDLELYNAAYAAASYKLAAKELADELTVVIRNADGKAVSEVYTNSAKAYAMKILGNSTSTAKLKTLIVDMLNYGAEAQTYFGYNTGNLANADLTVSQKDLATKAVSCTNKQVRGANFVGSNLTLEDRILLNLMFTGCDSEGMYAEISYTDYTGAAKAYTMEADQFGSHGSYIKITVDQIVLADAFSAVTVKLYNADGTVYGTGTDSVESYVARTGATAINEAIMKFAYAAKQYLT